MKHAPSMGTVTTARPLPSARRPGIPWAPATAGPYRLPRAVEQRLLLELAGFRNKEAAYALAVFLARFWSAPRKLLAAFPIDRRALAEHEALGLTEARVRGALAVLVKVGFLARYEPEAGKKYQRTETGLQRRAILHRFGEEYGIEFSTANAAAQRSCGAPAPARRPIQRPEPQRSPAANVAPPARPAFMTERPRPASSSQLAQKHSSSERGLIMGQENRADMASPLEAALIRLGRGLGL